MSAGYGPPAVNTFGMIAGLGDAFGKSYDAARKQAQEDEAPAIFSKLVGLQSGTRPPRPAAHSGRWRRATRTRAESAASR